MIGAGGADGVGMLLEFFFVGKGNGRNSATP